MGMNGIDIASHQDRILVANTPAEFVIVKATGGTGYINPEFNRQADETLRTGKKLGIYHYAREIEHEGSPVEEARHFLNLAMGYKGLFVPCLDWEALALNLPIAWAREWLDAIARETGATPMFYSGASYINSTDCSQIAHYPLWKASYLSRYSGSGFVDNPHDTWGSGSWPCTTIYQYTSTGRIPGYDGPLDLNFFHGGAKSWEAMCGKKPAQDPGEAVNDAGLVYRVHSQDVGWNEPAHDGQTAGTTGHGLRAEAIEFLDVPEGWELAVHAHLENLGWVTYEGIRKGNVVTVGTVGECRRIEMLMVEVVERPKGDKRRLQFKTHEQDYGWKADTPEGFASGSDGQSRRLEAFRFWID